MSLSLSSPDWLQVPEPQQTPGVNDFHPCLQGEVTILRGKMEPQTPSHSPSLWIPPWPLPRTQTKDRAEQSSRLGLHEERILAHNLRAAQEDQTVLSSRGPKRRWKEMEEIQKVKCQTRFCSNCFNHLSGKKAQSSDPKIKSSFHPFQNEIEHRWEIQPLLSLLTHHCPVSVSHQKPPMPHKIQPRRGQTHQSRNRYLYQFYGVLRNPIFME